MTGFPLSRFFLIIFNLTFWFDGRNLSLGRSLLLLRDRNLSPVTAYHEGNDLVFFKNFTALGRILSILICTICSSRTRASYISFHVIVDRIIRYINLRLEMNQIYHLDYHLNHKCERNLAPCHFAIQLTS